MSWTAAEVRELRTRLGLGEDLPGFARLIGVDLRTVMRWEDERHSNRPTGSAAAVMSALREKLNKDPSEEADVVRFILTAVAVGGLAYLLVKLLDQVEKCMRGASPTDAGAQAAAISGAVQLIDAGPTFPSADPIGPGNPSS